MFVEFDGGVPAWQDLLKVGDRRDRYGYCRGAIGQVTGRVLSRIRNIPIPDGALKRFGAWEVRSTISVARMQQDKVWVAPIIHVDDNP